MSPGQPPESFAAEGSLAPRGRRASQVCCPPRVGAGRAGVIAALTRRQPGEPSPAPNMLLSSSGPASPVATNPSGGASPIAPEPLPAAAASVRSRPPRGPPGPADTWSGAHQEPLQRPAPAPSSDPESGSPRAGGRRRRRWRRHPPPPAPSSSASLLPPPPPPPRAPHGPLFMARGREPGAFRRAESVLPGRARDRGPRGAGPGAGTRGAAAPGAGEER